MNKRVILIVLDSLGVGYAEDAHLFGDENSNTLGHILEKCPDLKIPNLSKFGILNLPGMSKYHSKNIEYIKGSYGRMKEISVGKDTTTGHWEIAGLETKEPFQTYPDGFPKEFIEAFENRLESVFLHPKLKRKVSYRTALKLDCYKLIKNILEGKEFVPFSLKEGM